MVEVSIRTRTDSTLLAITFTPASLFLLFSGLYQTPAAKPTAPQQQQ